MIDRPNPKPIAALPVSRAQSRMGSLRAVSGRFCQAMDILVLSGVFLLIAMLLLRHERGSLRDLLQASFSVRNAIVAAVCLGTWWMVLVSAGIYAPRRSPSLPAYIFRCLIGLNCCTVVIGFIQLVLRTRVDVWRFMGLYWLACLGAMALVRAVLLVLLPADKR